MAISRRNAILSAGVLPLAVAPAAGKLLAQDFTLVARVPEFGSYIHDPGMTILPSGRILAVSPCWQREGSGARRYLFVSRSGDGGKTWEQLDIQLYEDATPFVLHGALYMFVQRKNWQDVAFIRSDNEGETWTRPVTMFKGRYWNCSTGMATRDNRLYWAMNAIDWRSMVAVSADLSKDILDPAAWRMSPVLARPETPALLTRRLFKTDKKIFTQMWRYDNWLEPNVFLVNGKIRMASRTVTDEYATANLACVCDIDDDGKNLDFRFTQFYGWPGGQNKFFVLHDPVTRYFWMLTNLAADTQDFFGNRERVFTSGSHGAPGNERRNLALYYSIDALNWFPAGMVAQWPGMLQSFMYPSAAIDRNDIVFVSRTSQYARHQHDADRTTFHRIRNFRTLALDIRPGPDGYTRRLPKPGEDPLGEAGKVYAADAIVGRWMWHDGSHFTAERNGGVRAAVAGSWKSTGASTYSIALGGEIATVSFLGDGSVLAGKDAAGAEVWAVRLRG